MLLLSISAVILFEVSNKFFRFPFSRNVFYFSLGVHLLQDSFPSLILKIAVKGFNCYSVFPIGESVL